MLKSSPIESRYLIEDIENTTWAPIVSGRRMQIYEKMVALSIWYFSKLCTFWMLKPPSNEEKYSLQVLYRTLTSKNEQLAISFESHQKFSIVNTPKMVEVKLSMTRS
jgi:hypothetical protein